MRRILCLLALCLHVVPRPQAEVTFLDIDLAADNRLLFRAEADLPGRSKFSTLFHAELSSGALTQLTFYPEQMQLVGTPSRLQIQNRFGVFRTDSRLSEPVAVAGYESFADGRQIQTGKILPVLASPDGRFLLSMEPDTPAYADLVLVDLSSGRRELVSRRVELSLSGPLAAWSPDSAYFIYAKNGRLYYYSLDQLGGGLVAEESTRLLGEGAIPNVRWGSDRSLYYISGSLVYRILAHELYTRSLYQAVLRIGRIVGKLPFDFDHNFDSFWISPDGRKLLLNKAGRNIFIYHLRTDDFLPVGDSLSLPYLHLPRNTRLRKVLWPSSDIVSLLVIGMERGRTTDAIYRIDLRGNATAFTRQAERGVRDMELSPDGARVALVGAETITIKAYEDWRDLYTIEVEKPLGVLWNSDRELIVGGAYLVQVVDVESGVARVVALSQPEQFGFRAGTVQIRTRGVSRAWDPATSAWSVAEAFEPGLPQTASSDYRVYLEATTAGSYRNLVMVRNLKSLATAPLFGPPRRNYDPFPEKDDPVDFTNFRHGTRIRSREVAITFDLVDSPEGLTEILTVLAEYGVRATFFANGDFIRRNPGATREIADSGHEVGSMFFSHFNMADPRFSITREFIKQGLARNEDEYFSVTGRELALLWRAPYHVVSSTIIDASREMGYMYIGRDVDSLDWVARRDDQGLSSLYHPSADLIERILEQKRPGSIISMRVGTPGDARPGLSRNDYLFQRLDLLINLLIERGYRVVPVSTLVERSKQ